MATGAFSPSKKIAQTVTFAPQIARYVRLTALTEAGNRGPWSSAAELNVLGRADPTLSRTGWTIAADSQETSRRTAGPPARSTAATRPTGTAGGTRRRPSRCRTR